MRVIGTSGHVDHGKSTLVEKLSGINPDRLAEEQRRQMTIDLGFAWIRLPDGEPLGIVDVPGHRDFIENMLAGVGGIDAALLVIAADEGIMPQTREHLAILRLLDVRNIIVVVSKIDLIDDPEWIELVHLEIEELLEQHQLDQCPIVEVSAHSGAGIDELVSALQVLLDSSPQRADYGQPRLPIDRVFVVGGFGTVVTGTLSRGSLSVGDSVELQPSSRRGRIRGLQSYKQNVDCAEPGSRVAVNVTGIGNQQIRRGDVLAHPGAIQPTILADVHFTLLGDVGRPLAHNAQVKFFSGAAESIANVRLLDKDVLAPGEEGWLQIRLRDELALARGDRFVLRYPSPPQTIGGGVIVNAHPGRRRKRFQNDIIQDLETRLSGSPAERLAQAARSEKPQSGPNLRKALGYDTDEFAAALAHALEDNLVLELQDKSIWSTESWRVLASQAHRQLGNFHQQQPLRLGIPRAEFCSRLKITVDLLDRLVEEDEHICAEAGFIRLHDHEIVFTDAQRAKVDQLQRILREQAFTPPSIEEMNRLAGEEVVRALLDMRELINVSDKIAFARASYDHMVAEIRQHILDHGEIDAKTVRDAFGASRKYAIAMLEHLDSLGVTQRIGDVRKRGRNI